MNKPVQLGITGGIGAGKSVVCRVLQCLGVPIYDADSRAKKLMNESQIIKDQVIDMFGAAAYNEKGLDNQYLAKIVFNDALKVAELNKIVHPQVKNDYEKWVSHHCNAPLVVKEAALIFETGGDKALDLVCMVTADEKVRIDRVLKRDPHRSEAQVRAIISKQMPETEKISKADFVIVNDEKKLIIPEIVAIYRQLAKK